MLQSVKFYAAIFSPIVAVVRYQSPRLLPIVALATTRRRTGYQSLSTVLEHVRHVQ